MVKKGSVTSQSQIWLSPTLTLSKARTRTNNTAYAFVLASRKKINPSVEMHLTLEFICWWDSLSTSKVGQLPTHAMPLTLGPLVGSNTSLLGRDVTGRTGRMSGPFCSQSLMCTVWVVLGSGCCKKWMGKLVEGEGAYSFITRHLWDESHAGR